MQAIPKCLNAPKNFMALAVVLGTALAAACSEDPNRAELPSSPPLPVPLDDRQTFLDPKTGRLFEERYQIVLEFSEGLAGVVTEDWSFHYIDPAGDVALRPGFDGRGFVFEGGLAQAGMDDRVGLMDRQGDFVVAPRSGLQFGGAGEGLIAFRENGKYGYMDMDGKVVIELEPQFVHASAFSEGLAAVLVRVEGGTKLGYIDRTGHMVIPARFDGGGAFRSGLANVRIGENEGAYIDRNGQVRLDGFETALPISEGVCVVKMDGKYGVVDLRGHWIVEPTFAHLSTFSEGLAEFKQDDSTGLTGYVRVDGGIAIEPGFVDTHPFENGVAEVRDDEGREGYIDRYGEWIYFWKRE